MPLSPGDVTLALRDVQAGGDAAADAGERLWDAVYGELRQMAQRELRGGLGGETLSATALVHEAYLKLVGPSGVPADSRTHFFALSCRVMRQVLVDHARRRRAVKRGGGAEPVPLDDAMALAEERSDALLALDEALTQLGQLDPRLERVVECRYFGGLSTAETAEVLGASARTVERDWTRAKAYLYRALAA